jgi:hypothetical protein
MTLRLSEPDKIRINDILNIIAEDEELLENVSRSLGIDQEDFSDWIHSIEV